MNNLPSKLTKLRKHYNYSQSFLAQTLGVDVFEYMKYENGEKILSYNQCKKLATFYHVGVADIFSNSDDVILYDVLQAKTDQINIEYFLPKKDLKYYIKKYWKQASMIIFPILIVVLFISSLTRNTKNNYIMNLGNDARLSCSETTVVYIDELGAVKGRGDNSNSQLSDLPTSNAKKVVEGSNFTATLYANGTISVSSRLNTYNEAEQWENIIDISAGTNHLVALNNKGKVFGVGDNSVNQIDTNEFEKIIKIFALPNATIALDLEGKIHYVGEFIGSSKIKSYTNIKDLDVSENILAILTRDGRVEYFTKDENIYKVNNYHNIIDIACGDNFIAALDDSGKVYISIQNSYSAEKEVETWSNIIAIASDKDYLVAYDGKTVKGVGKNTYDQYESTTITKPILPQVQNIKIDYDDENVNISFDTIKNAVGYLVTFDTGGFPQSTLIYKNSVSFSSKDLIDSTVYTITIKSIADENYEDSNPVSKSFTFHKEERFLIENLFTKSPDELKEYLEQLGVKEIIGEISEDCEQTSCIISIDGISENTEYTKRQLSELIIKYTYCLEGTEEE